jgi:hypothetical protein
MELVHTIKEKKERKNYPRHQSDEGRKKQKKKEPSPFLYLENS